MRPIRITAPDITRSTILEAIRVAIDDRHGAYVGETPTSIRWDAYLRLNLYAAYQIIERTPEDFIAALLGAQLFESQKNPGPAAAGHSAVKKPRPRRGTKGKAK